MARFPTDEQRLAIYGTTGSGKTQAALYHLSRRDFHVMPWVVYNWKGDRSIDDIPGAFDLGLNEIPDRPGVYIVHPLPHDDELVENQMQAIWERENTGIFVDEGYMIPRNAKWFRALLTQGRSRHVPIITLSQRPVWMDRYVISESDFHQVFRLEHEDDLKTIQKFIRHARTANGKPVDLEADLPDYHSYYYDRGLRRVHTLKPVPDIKQIHATFARRLLPVKRVV
jgi:hypothetical protein